MQLEDGEETDTEKRIVELKDIEQRVQVPWAPRDLADNFIVFRRRLGRTDEYIEYIEDLRVRRNFVRRILDLLMEPGFYRPDQANNADICIIPRVTASNPTLTSSLMMVCPQICTFAISMSSSQAVA